LPREITQLSAEAENHSHGIGRSNQYYKIPAWRRKYLDQGNETAKRLSLSERLHACTPGAEQKSNTCT